MTGAFLSAAQGLGFVLQPTNCGIRAAHCGESYSARCAREHNDANILTLGSRVLGAGLALEIVRVFLETPFEGGRHLLRLEKIQKLEESSG